MTLKYKIEKENSVIGYDFPINNNSKEQNHSLLEGSAGLLFSYLNFLDSNTDLTEEVLFLRF